MEKQLLEILQQELKAMQGLLQVLEEQYEFLVKQDVFKLEAIVGNIEEASRELARCESKRRGLVGKSTLKEITEKVKNEEISLVCDDINKIIAELQLQKDSNDLLIKQSLSYTNAMLAMISPKQEKLTYNGYGKIGK